MIYKREKYVHYLLIFKGVIKMPGEVGSVP